MSANPPGDDVISNAIAIKNIPFEYPEGDFTNLFRQLGLTAPYAFNYFKSQSPQRFLGVAFANFWKADDAQAAVARLNGYPLEGRVLRVELKKTLPPEELERKRLERLARLRNALQPPPTGAPTGESGTSGPSGHAGPSGHTGQIERSPPIPNDPREPEPVLGSLPSSLQPQMLLCEPGPDAQIGKSFMRRR